MLPVVAHPELSIREDIRKRFLREGYAANSVKHPGAVLVVDDDVAEDGAAFLVMELLDGIGCEELWERSSRHLQPAVALASSIGVDSTSVYWANYLTGDVWKCAIGGCSNSPTRLASGQSNPNGLTVDSNGVYWCNNNAGTVVKCPVTGCGSSPTVLASGQSSPLRVVSDGTYLYWINDSNPGSVMMCAVAGCNGNPTTLATGQQNPGSIAVDATSVYWTNASGEIMRVAKP